MVKDLPVGEYDYYVNAIHSDESESGFDRQSLTITPSMFVDLDPVEIDKIMCGTFSLDQYKIFPLCNLEE